jgi:arylsulfatase A-like enzyme
VGIPLIVRDPRPADISRGTVDERLVETIDALPTFLDALGLPAAEHRLEGRSLIPLLHGEHSAWRRYAISEYDYAFQAPARERLGQPIDRCRMTMVRSERWKYLAYDGFRRSCSTWKMTRRSCTIWAPIRRMPKCAKRTWVSVRMAARVEAAHHHQSSGDQSAWPAVSLR